MERRNQFGFPFESQGELFPEERKPSRFWHYLPYLTVGAVILMLAGSVFA